MLSPLYGANRPTAFGEPETEITDSPEDSFRNPMARSMGDTLKGKNTPITYTDPESGITKVHANQASRDPSAVQAAVTRAEWDYTKNTFLPVEGEVIDRVLSGDEINSSANRAGVYANKGYNKSAEIADRNLQRRGLRRTAQQQNAVDRRSAIARTTGVADAENKTRRGLRDRNRGLLASLTAQSQGLVDNANTALGTAAGLASNRAAAGDAMRAQKKQQQMSGIGAGIGLAAAGMPWLGAGAAVLGFL